MLDNKYISKEKETKWMEYWKDNNVYEFKRDLPLRDARDALKPSFFRKAGRFKIIGRVNNG